MEGPQHMHDKVISFLQDKFMKRLSRLERVFSRPRSRRILEQRGIASDILVCAGTAGHLGRIATVKASRLQESGNCELIFIYLFLVRGNAYFFCS